MYPEENASPGSGLRHWRCVSPILKNHRAVMPQRLPSDLQMIVY